MNTLTNNRRTIALALGAASALVAMPALAASPGSPISTPVLVSTTIPNACTIPAVGNVTFANPPGLTVAQEPANGSVTVNCTNGGTYTITLDGGQNHTTTNQMQKGATGAFLTYGLFQDAAFTIPFGTTPTLTGTGVNVPTTIYGKLNAQTATQAGTYNDTVQATVTF